MYVASTAVNLQYPFSSSLFITFLFITFHSLLALISFRAAMVNCLGQLKELSTSDSLATRGLCGPVMDNEERF